MFSIGADPEALKKKKEHRQYTWCSHPRVYPVTFVRRRAEGPRPGMAAAVSGPAALVELAAVAVAGGQRGAAVEPGTVVVTAVNPRQGWRRRSNVCIRATNPSGAAGSSVHFRNQRRGRCKCAKKTIHIIRSHIFFSDLLAHNPQCRFYEGAWYMTAIHTRFTPKSIFTLDRGIQPCDPGLAALGQWGGRTWISLWRRTAEWD